MIVYTIELIQIYNRKDASFLANSLCALTLLIKAMPSSRALIFGVNGAAPSAASIALEGGFLHSKVATMSFEAASCRPAFELPSFSTS